MKRLQIMIEEDLDAALERQAREEGVSKAALVRESVRSHLKVVPSDERDPLWSFFGYCDGPPLAPGETIDDVLYGPIVKHE